MAGDSSHTRKASISTTYLVPESVLGVTSTTM